MTTPIPIRPRHALLRPLDPPVRPIDWGLERRSLIVLLNMVTGVPLVLIALLFVDLAPAAWFIACIWVVMWAWMAVQYMMGRVR